jgi:hypothetical protein
VAGIGATPIDQRGAIRRYTRDSALVSPRNFSGSGRSDFAVSVHSDFAVSVHDEANTDNKINEVSGGAH